jgi:hypothetical protein
MPGMVYHWSVSVSNSRHYLYFLTGGLIWEIIDQKAYDLCLQEKIFEDWCKSVVLLTVQDGSSESGD